MNSEKNCWKIYHEKQEGKNKEMNENFLSI